MSRSLTSESAVAEIEDRWQRGGRIWIVSDLHGNGPASRTALELAGRNRDSDGIVLLGDLLTYGCHPIEVLEEIEAWAERLPVLWVRGNHDEIYQLLGRGVCDVLEALPGWIQESFEWTLAEIEGCQPILWSELFSLTLGPVVLSHANPFGPGDWTYLNDDLELDRAASVLQDRGLWAGLFGHTHRPLLYSKGTSPGAGARTPWRPGQVIRPTRERAHVANVGSVGQPRDASRRATLGWVRQADGDLAMGLEEVDYDLEEHRARISSSGMSEATRDRLWSFFSTPEI